MEARKQEEARFHNKIRDRRFKEKDAPEYERLTSNYKFYSITRRSRRFVEGWLKKECPNKVALDYCCGEGGMAVFLSKNGAKRVIGIDISETSIENCRKRAKQEGIEENTSFFVMDGEGLKFEQDLFDIVVCSGVLHHLDIERAYSELSRILKPEGKIICIEPLAYNPIFQLYRKLTPNLRTEWEMEHILTAKEINLSKKYFDRIEIKFFHLITLLAVPFRDLPIFNFVLKPLEIMDAILLRLPLFRWLAWQTVFILSDPKKC